MPLTPNRETHDMHGVKEIALEQTIACDFMSIYSSEYDSLTLVSHAAAVASLVQVHLRLDRG